MKKNEPFSPGKPGNPLNPSFPGLPGKPTAPGKPLSPLGPTDSSVSSYKIAHFETSIEFTWQTTWSEWAGKTLNTLSTSCSSFSFLSSSTAFSFISRNTWWASFTAIAFLEKYYCKSWLFQSRNELNYQEHHEVHLVH